MCSVRAPSYARFGEASRSGAAVAYNSHGRAQRNTRTFAALVRRPQRQDLLQSWRPVSVRVTRGLGGVPVSIGLRTHLSAIVDANEWCG
jgi:hypothetical protein